MICISVTPASRRLAKADLLNAARQCDLIELCLDRLIKPPDMAELLQGVDKPVLVSCRRLQDGGHWDGSEEDRLRLLREAIVAEPAYIELELDIAGRIPRFGKTRRVVSYTRLDKPLGNIDSVFQRAAHVNADVVKFTWPTPTLEAAWPLLAAVTQKRDLPVVGLGLGPAGLTFSLLGRKYGSPWIYAALERGMEAYDGQPTVGELDDIHGWRQIDRRTRFVGVVGFGEAEATTVRVFNAGVRNAQLNTRCLPLASADFGKLRQMLEVLKIKALLTGADAGEAILSLAEQVEDAAESAGHADLLLKQADGWHGYNSLWRSALKALETTLGGISPDDRPLDRRNVLVLGAGGLARTMAFGASRRKALVSITSGDDDAARHLAQALNARHVVYASLYDTLADVVVVADPDLELGPNRTQLNPAFLRESMTLLDVTRMPGDSALLREGRARGCRVVEPSAVYAEQIVTQFQSITGQDLPNETVLRWLAAGV